MDKNKKRLSFIFVLILSVLIVPGTQADEVCDKGGCFAPEKVIGTTSVPLHGIGKATFFIFDVYTAALYFDFEGSVAAPKLFAEEPIALEIFYHRDLGRDIIINSAQDVLKKNPTFNLTKLKPRIDQISQAYEDVKAGDRYELVYHPKTGTSLLHNGELKVTIPGEDFAFAYFGIWISDWPLSQTLKKQLTTKKEMEA